MSTSTGIHPGAYPEATYYETYSEDDDVPHPHENTETLRRRSAMTSTAAMTHSPELAHSSRPDGRGNPDPASRGIPAVQPPPLEASWINAEPFDEFIREISDFVASVSKGRTNIEVEAKIGILIDTRTNQRLNLPVLSESILPPDLGSVRFDTNMSVEQHAHYNRLLNGRVETTSSSSYPYAKIGYSHTKVVDSFHPSPGSSSKLRVTTDEKTGAVNDCVVKERLGDLNVYCPRRKVDWRVSVNTETPVGRPTTSAQHTRRKDRLTYTHQAFRIDLTQVHASQDPSKLQHELEVEFQDSEELMRLASLKEMNAEGGWAFDELIRVFVNNVRILVRNAL